MNAWGLLGIEPTNDTRAIKRAYSVKLKTTRPDDDAQAYQALREAYDWALNNAKFFVTYSLTEVNPPVAESELPAAEPRIEREPEPEPEPVPVPVPVPEPAALLVVQEATPEPPTREPEPEPEPQPDRVAPVFSAPQADIAPAPSAQSVLGACARAWADEGSSGLVKAWPSLQAQLEDLPVTDHNVASKGFAQFVAQESDLPVQVLIALTRHFQWGLDFRVDQMLGSQLSDALYQRLIVADVFAAFRPEKYAQFAWPLALVKLWDAKHGVLARLLAAGLDCQTRLRILEANAITLQALGASGASITAMKRFVAKWGNLQAMVFLLLVGCALVCLYEPDMLGKIVLDAIVLGTVSFFLFFLQGEFPEYEALLNRIRRGHNLDGLAWIPLFVGVLVWMDHQSGWLAGYASAPEFLVWMTVAYAIIWLLLPTRDMPWHRLVLPTFVVLLVGVMEVLPTVSAPLVVSLAFAWTLGAHVVLRRYPHHFEGWYSTWIKLGVIRAKPWYLLAFHVIPIGWVLMAIAILPVLLFRMAVLWNARYAGAAIFAGALLAHAHSTDWQTQGLILWVLAVVLCIQVFQTLAQKLADYGIKRLSR